MSGRPELKIEMEKVYKTKKNPRGSKVLGEALFMQLFLILSL